MLSERVIDALLTILDSERELFIELVAARFRNEIPLQEKLYQALKPIMPGLIREKAYAQSAEKCDFWCSSSEGSEAWLELKLCPTNYCRKFGDTPKSIAITQQIGQVIFDCNKLARVDPLYERKVVLLTYPMPVGEDHAQWDVHKNRILMNAQRISPMAQVAIRRHGVEAAINVYQIDV